MSMKLAVLFLLIDMLSTHQAICFQVMEEKHLTLSFMVVHSFMMLLLVLSGLRIKSLLELVKPSWLKNALNNSFGNWLLLKFTTFTVTTEFSMLSSLLKAARTSTKLSHFLSWCSPSRCSCQAVNSNHHVHGQDLNGSCFFALELIWS